MTEAEKAYQAALEEVERVKREGGTELWFDKEQFRALDMIPPEVGNVSGLRLINLIQTSVTDLRPLALASSLRTLWLNQTAVTNLEPLTGLAELRGLFLASTLVSDLKPLSTLRSLEVLWLDMAPVTDISPLASLQSLITLRLNGSAVEDLRPIRSLRKLGISGFDALDFSNCAATQRDAEISRLCHIDHETIRTRETLAYLNTLPPWPEPYLPKARPDGKPPEWIGKLPDPPAPDPALPLIWGEKGFAFLAVQVEADPVTEAALDDLRPLLDDLRRKGNRHDDLYRIAGELQERASGEVSALNMVKLHLSYQKLRRVYEGRAARLEGFDDETISVMAGVLEIVPGVTLADPGVKTLIERQEAERARKLPPATVAAEEQVLHSVLGEEAPFDPAVKDTAEAILQPGMQDRLAASRGILSRNTVIVVLTYVGCKAADGVISGPVGNYLYEHGPDLLAYARTMGDDAFFWAQMVFTTFKGQYELAMGLAREITTSGAVRLPPKKTDD